MDSREQFEEWFEREYKHLESSKYTDVVPHIKYGFLMSWQASRAAIEIELPEKISPHNTNESGYVIGQAAMYDEAIDDCADALAFAGLRYHYGEKPKGDLPLQHEAKEE